MSFLQACIIVESVPLNQFGSLSEEAILDRAERLLTPHMALDNVSEADNEHAHFDFWDSDTFDVVPVADLNMSTTESPDAIITPTGDWIDTWNSRAEYRVVDHDRGHEFWPSLAEKHPDAFAVFVLCHW